MMFSSSFLSTYSISTSMSASRLSSSQLAPGLDIFRWMSRLKRNPYRIFSSNSRMKCFSLNIKIRFLEVE